MRQCGDCQLCCRLLPVKELGKGDGVRCQHQRFKKGCAIYARRPFSCRVWSCRWLVDKAAGDLSRPDRSHYVIDIMADFITITDDADGSIVSKVPVVQVWVDPAYPDAHRDPALLAYLEKRGEAALIRFSKSKGMVIFPPSMTGEVDWIETETRDDGAPEHTAAEIAAVMNHNLN